MFDSKRPTPATRRGLAALVAAFSLTTLAACSSDHSATSSGGTHATTASGASGSSSMSGSSTTDAARANDVMFAQMMIPHHEQAVVMADMALNNTTSSAKVRDLATKIKAAQAPEIATMTGWLTTWGASAMPEAGMHHDDGMMTDAQMKELGAASGAQFDKLWLTMMISHHEGAVTMAQQVLTTTQDPAVKQMAQNIVTSQTSEIATMKTML